MQMLCLGHLAALCRTLDLVQHARMETRQTRKERGKEGEECESRKII